MKLNIGCGSRRLPGYIGCDVTEGPEVDVVAQADKIPLADGCAEEVLAVHLLEHLPRWGVAEALAEWKRLLVPGGMLVLELPNLVKCCENYLSGRMRGGKHPDQLARFGIYGDPRLQNKWMLHAWGYSPEEVIQILTEAGFEGAVEKPTVFHPCGRDHRDMRLESRKPANA